MATITEDYVSFEIAKLLKEKGFMEGAIIKFFASGYDSKGNILDIRDTELKDYPRPTIQMTVKWLVRKYRLYVNVVPSVEGYYWTEKWHSYVEDLNKRYPYGRFIGTLISPEEAYKAGIKYCLEHLI